MGWLAFFGGECNIAAYIQLTYRLPTVFPVLLGFDMTKKHKTKKKDSQLIIRINTEEREQFINLCEHLDTSAAREIRHFIRGFIKENDTEVETEKSES